MGISSNFITIESMVVVDARVDSAASLNPVPNNAKNGNTAAPISAGSLGWLSLLLSLVVVSRRKRTV